MWIDSPKVYESDKEELPKVCSIWFFESIKRNNESNNYNNTTCDKKCIKIWEKFFSQLHEKVNAEKLLVDPPFKNEKITNDIKNRSIPIYISSEAKKAEWQEWYNFPYSRLSWTIINKQSIITCAHGINEIINPNGNTDYHKLYIYDSNWDRLNVTDIKTHSNEDISIITFVPTKNTNKIKQINYSDDTSGDLISIWYTKDAEDNESHGFSYDLFHDTTSNILLMASSNIITQWLSAPGDSGWGLFNTKWDFLWVLESIMCPNIIRDGHSSFTPASTIKEVNKF